MSDTNGRAYSNSQPIKHDATSGGGARHRAPRAFTRPQGCARARCASCATYAQIVARYEELLALYREKYEEYEENTKIYKSNERAYKSNEKAYEANEKIYKSNEKNYRSIAEIDRTRIERFRDQIDGFLADLARERVIKSPHRGQSLKQEAPGSFRFRGRKW